MQTSPTGPIYWLRNIYIGKFENISINNVLGHLFSHKSATKYRFRYRKKALNSKNIFALKVEKKSFIPIHTIQEVLKDINRYDEFLSNSKTVKSLRLNHSDNWVDAYQYISSNIPFLSDRKYCFRISSEQINKDDSLSIVHWFLLDQNECDIVGEMYENNAIYLHFTGEIEQAKNEFMLNAEKDPISKRNLDFLYFNITQIKGNQNSLSKILVNPLNMFDIFLSRSNIIPDTTTKYINSFANTVLEKKYVNEIELMRFNNKAIGKLYIATYTDKYKEITENQLISFADEIIYTNMFRYYTYNDWVVRYDASGTKTVYLLTFNN